MKTTGLFQELLYSLLERTRSRSHAGKNSPINELCRELITERGDVSGYAISQTILDRYKSLEDSEKLEFFQFLNDDMDIDSSALEEAVSAYKKEASPANFKNLTLASEPKRRELLDRINQLPGATETLVEMRADLLRFCRTETRIKKTDQDFQHMFLSWFNRGFLVLRQINWHTPANILEKIIQYEAVHAINGWEDLRRRLEPTDRRCFAFFHPSIPDDPLIFVEVAICKGVPNSIQNLLSEDRQILENTKADTATFYSISNCQAGLAGISFGNFLIKQVVSDLSKEIPNLSNFVTLSPLPSFSKWLVAQANEENRDDLNTIIEAQKAALESEDYSHLKEQELKLRGLASEYLYNAKREDRIPLDPVARFHLSNGALIHDVHAQADLSPNGIKQSFGVMTNYLYDLKKVESNHEDFAKNGKVNISKKIETLLKAK